MVNKNNINLYLHNYYLIDTINYILTDSNIYIDPKVRFDIDFDMSNFEPELFLINRFKDIITKRVFINGKAVSSKSITQLGEFLTAQDHIITKLNSINIENEKIDTENEE